MKLRSGLKHCFVCDFGLKYSKSTNALNLTTSVYLPFLRRRVDEDDMNMLFWELRWSVSQFCQALLKKVMFACCQSELELRSCGGGKTCRGWTWRKREANLSSEFNLTHSRSFPSYHNLIRWDQATFLSVFQTWLPALDYEKHELTGNFGCLRPYLFSQIIIDFMISQNIYKLLICNGDCE